MRCLIFRPLVLISTFLVGLFATFLFTFAGDALTQLFDDPSSDIPALCRSAGTEGFNACAQPTMREAEEYAVYSTLLNAMYDGGHSDRILIRDQTSVDNLEDKAIASPLESLRLQNPLVEQETLDSFRGANEHSYRFDSRFRLPGASRFVDAQELEGYFREGGGGWQAFNRDYRNAGGFITLSRVGFNRDLNQALVYLASACGETCGLGSLVFLVKEGGTWRIKGTTSVWIS
jgi:hypothetical protein